MWGGVGPERGGRDAGYAGPAEPASSAAREPGRAPAEAPSGAALIGLQEHTPRQEGSYFLHRHVQPAGCAMLSGAAQVHVLIDKAWSVCVCSL